MIVYSRWTAAGITPSGSANQVLSAWTALVGAIGEFYDIYAYYPNPQNKVTVLSGSKILFKSCRVDLRGIPGVRPGTSGMGLLSVAIAGGAYVLPVVEFGKVFEWGQMSSPLLVNEDLLMAAKTLQIDTRNLQGIYQTPQDFYLDIALDVDLVRA